VNGRPFHIPDGFELRQVVTSILVQRPISAAQDEFGRLYVTDCNGSNEPLGQQLQNPGHRIVRLDDHNGDGQFDESTVYADRMMFPEGAMWHEGSLYVAAPPAIWKLTDTNDDGVADVREVWFDGKSITHCGNDLHGPFVGPDGWIYWSKGAWAEQTHPRPGGKPPLVTRAAHIFRRRPDSPFSEPVMTGGMDNPVEVVFMPNGERIFCTTFLQHPGGGLRDGLIHAVYGGVYGKDHPAAFQGHARTGDLLPPLVHMGAAAPSSLLRIESNQLGPEYVDNVVTGLFNMHKLTRSVLHPDGATYMATTEDFVLSTDVDFHPTDVLEDADGSLLIVDTGGWYKLCCPTSQLAKPDVFGTIYRLTKKGSHRVIDPRGEQIPWGGISAAQLVEHLADPRPAVRDRAMAELARFGASAVGPLSRGLTTSTNPRARRAMVGTLSRIDDIAARTAIRTVLADDDHDVRQMALHCISAWRDEAAVDSVRPLLQDPSLNIRRAAAEAMGRIGGPTDVPHLLAAVELPADRVLEHSLAYALIEIGDATQLGAALDHSHPVVQRVALMALDQIAGEHLSATVAVEKLRSDNSSVRDTAWWIISRHPDWAGAMVDYLRDQLATRNSTGAGNSSLPTMITTFLRDSAIQNLVADNLVRTDISRDARADLLAAVGGARFERVSPALRAAVLSELRQPAGPNAQITLRAFDNLAGDELAEEELEILQQLADPQAADEFRMRVLGVIAKRTRRADDASVHFLCERLHRDTSPELRGQAVEILTRLQLENRQRRWVADLISQVSPLDLKKLVDTFGPDTDADIRTAVVTGLSQSTALAALTLTDLRTLADRFGSEHQDPIQMLIQRVEKLNAEKAQRFSAVLALLDQADARRGQLVFQGAKASCSACHKAGYLGGDLGPDLSRIGDARSEADLLESILLPNATLVRSFEPVTIITDDGKSYNGLVRAESATEITLALDATKTVRIPKSSIEQQAPGTVSTMPSGIDQALTAQELADLVKFLKVAR
jgi:putative membrane-bound dehydrogenase-like protein